MATLGIVMITILLVLQAVLSVFLCVLTLASRRDFGGEDD